MNFFQVEMNRHRIQVFRVKMFNRISSLTGITHISGKN